MCVVYAVSGEWTEDQCFAQFLKTFDSGDNPDGIVCIRVCCVAIVVVVVVVDVHHVCVLISVCVLLMCMCVLLLLMRVCPCMCCWHARVLYMYVSASGLKTNVLHSF